MIEAGLGLLIKKGENRSAQKIGLGPPERQAKRLESFPEAGQAAGRAATSLGWPSGYAPKAAELMAGF